MKISRSSSLTRNKLYLSITCLATLYAIFAILGVESQNDDDYGERDPNANPGSEDYENRPEQEDMMDEDRRPHDYPGEKSGKKKKFKLFEKRRYAFEKAKAFCKSRDGKLAQIMGDEETERIHILIARGKKLKHAVWVGAGSSEWKQRQQHNGGGYHPDMDRHREMMGGDPSGMCPSMNLEKKHMEGDPCFEKLSFICQFPMNKNGTQPTSPTTRRPKKDEMKKKR